MVTGLLLIVCLLSIDHASLSHIALECSSSTFSCKTTDDCVDLRERCDGFYHCPDGSDKECTTPDCVSPGVFSCNISGHCFSLSRVCNGVENCPDGSDEVDCMTKACPVPGDLSYNCPSVYGNASCVPDEFSCDGDADCSEEEDEQGCDSGIIAIDVDVEDPETAGCPTVLVHCGFPVKICMNEFLICDGQVDCPFGEDEEECGDTDDTDLLTSITLTTGMTTETFTQDSRKTAECPTFYCGTSGSTDPSCVLGHLICDGHLDCVSGEDEQGCGHENETSTQTSFTPTAGATTQDAGETAECPTFYCGLSNSTEPSCVQEHLICDGQPDCALGEDEQGCGTSTQASITSSIGLTSGQGYFEEQTECYAGSHGSQHQAMGWMTVAALGGHIIYRLAF